MTFAGKAASLTKRWPGRVVLRSAEGAVRIEIFDRAMTIAAQLFTSVFPIMIMAAEWLRLDDFERLSQAVNMPPQIRLILRDALASNSGNAFGVVGTLVVLISATSLSRALARAFGVLWNLPRARRRLTDMWRWLAAVLVLALAMIVTRVLVSLTRGVPLSELWSTAADVIFYALVGVFVPWLVLAGRVPVRRLIPGAIVLALVMLVLRPATTIVLPHALESSAARYGSIGVAFTYLTLLYVFSWVLLSSAIVGQVLGADEGPVGRLIRHDSPPDSS